MKVANECMLSNRCVAQFGILYAIELISLVPFNIYTDNR